MPFVNMPIECFTCRGSGKIKPVCAFKTNEQIMTIECVNCAGTGKRENKVYINPISSDKQVKNDEVSLTDDDSLVNSEEEVDYVVKKIKSKREEKIKSKRKEKRKTKPQKESDE